MTASLTPRDRVVVMALMSLNAEATTKDLKDRFGLDLTGEARRRLNGAGLVTSTKRGRSFVHALDDKGWDWCWNEMTESAPAGSRAEIRTLYAVLGGLRHFLDRTNRSLDDVFGVDVAESRIRAAYWALADAPAAWVRITDVRKRLDDLPAEQVTEALARLERERDVHLVPETDQQRLTSADRDAAVHVGGKDKHLLRVDR